MKIKIHSNVDLITNSSTTIFTYSDGSLSALKELVNEMLKVFDKTEIFDDIFYAEVFLDDDSQYWDAIEKSDLEIDFDTSNDYVENVKKEVLFKMISKPDWMIQAEENDEFYEGYCPATIIEIVPKERKYLELASKLTDYLYSTDHEAVYN